MIANKIKNFDFIKYLNKMFFLANAAVKTASTSDKESCTITS